MGKIANRAAEASQFFALTEEYHRLSVLTKGQLLDSDGSVLFNYFTEFGETQAAEIPFNLDATTSTGALRKACAAVVRQMAATLDGLPFTGIRALCSDSFFDSLIGNVEVRETYKNYEAAATLRQAYVNGSGQQTVFGSFEFGGITFENYRGGQTVGIAADKVNFFPEGVPGLFRTVQAPADYIETVNTPGQRLYAKQWVMPNGKGVNLEFQMNALHYCTRPRVLLQGRKGT
jgi:hypothetical protein